MVVEGKVRMQDKASCFPAHAIGDVRGWTVFDACAAPGNKTTHLASRMHNEGKVIAFDKDKERYTLLKRTVAEMGASCVECVWSSFLDTGHDDERYLDVRGAILDPSCSGSGIVTRVAMEGERAKSGRRQGQGKGEDVKEGGGGEEKGMSAEEEKRLRSLADFQFAIVHHALSFPSMQRAVYSTCSVHSVENEQVVARVLDAHPDFELAHAIPEWRRRGEGPWLWREKVVRALPEDGTIGFFVAVFQRKEGEK
mmetsp:Transcript_26903/g.69181  ORF Transcript_26903/g.69181 Transcript_26903/m.69181 type:complete len:253 (-) Transcript_26903:108-866(-)